MVVSGISERSPRHIELLSFGGQENHILIDKRAISAPVVTVCAQRTSTGALMRKILQT